MPFVSVGFGAMLIALGVWGYVVSDAKSMTALIPAAVGDILVLLGLLGMIERFLKHAMHAAVTIALIGGIAAAATIKREAIMQFNPQDHATISKAGMNILCLAFVALCVNSFIQARRRRRAATATQTQIQG